MSDQTEPRVWNAGDPMPRDVFKIRDSMGDVWERNVTLGGALWCTPETVPMEWERIAKKYGPLSEVQTSSPVSVPAEPGNASERPSQAGETGLWSIRDGWVVGPTGECTCEAPYEVAGIGHHPSCGIEQWIPAEDLPGVFASEENLRRRASSWWEAAKTLNRWGNAHRAASRTAGARADAAEAKLAIADDHHKMELAEANRLLTAYQRDVVAWKRERDEARAKLAEAASEPHWCGQAEDLANRLDEIREDLSEINFDEVTHLVDVGMDGDESGDCIDECPGCALVRIRSIVERDTTEASR
ncbi:hypothetical protein VSH64_24980 [Amycolatopsis rhabdoformis]|uniref:Uncharacterized protein n=1 Tax=Amycolatopsis rhabdoformis TaxID=1448059 RepID=A0ABZ1HX22_9PSEU|nr:hypothetical protein [Amycolatopsis rhabdoformis]WSE26133.1 hypothetical protein VSH64_24980 [Amycolatopsis rhabdoformis]